MDFKNNAELCQFFDSLPSYVQETIMQSGVEIQSLEQLKKIAEEYNAK